MPPKIPEPLRDLVRQKANFLCEYCHTAEHWQLTRFTIDHILPISLGGTDNQENLALACFHCNRRKSNKISVLQTGDAEEVQLFNPRTMLWSDHFIWSRDAVTIVPLTAIGKATIRLLRLNDPRLAQLRYDDLLVERHPPVGDPRQK